MKKIFKKMLFTIKVANLGSNLKSKLILLRESIRIQKNFYTKGQNKPFECYLGKENRKVKVNLRGTMDEIHALTEIFIDKCYDPHIEIRTALDLGANIGLASIWLWLNFPDCIINAYEPDPEVYKVLEKNLGKLSYIKTFNMAIASEAGSLEFYSSERSFSSSLYPIPKSKVIYVPSKTLDDAISDIGGGIDFMKIDIEGAEFSVLEKSKKLNNINVIIGEIHPKKADGDVEDIKNALSKTHQIRNIGVDKSLFYATRME